VWVFSRPPTFAALLSPAGPFLPLLLFLSVLAVYGSSITHPFHYDDRLFLGDENIQEGRWRTILWPPSPRALTWLTFLLQHQLHGPDAAPFHLFNVVLHGVNTCLVLLLLVALLNPPGVPRAPPAAEPVPPGALLGALVFAFHPVQTESVLYVYQRSTLLAGLFALLSLMAWLARRHLVALLLLVPAVAAKEVSLALPVVFWAADRLLQKRRRASRWSLAALAAGVAGGIVALSSQWITQDRTIGGTPAEALTYAATQVNVFWLYVWRLVYPLSLNLDPDVSLQRHPWDPVWWLALAALGTVCWGLVLLCRRRPVAGFSGLLFLAFLLPSSSLIPSQDAMSEHRLYLPMIGAAGLLAALVRIRPPERSRTPRRPARWLAYASLAGLILGYIAIDLQRGRIWSDEVLLWRNTVSKSPQKYRPNYNLGVLLLDTVPEESVRYLTRAVEIDPSNPLAFRGLGQVFFNRGEFESAERAWRQALVLDENHAATHLALGQLYARRSDFFRARHHLIAARKLDSFDWRPYHRLAGLLFQFGFPEEAVAECEAGLRRHPRRAELRFLLADIMTETHNWDRAVELYREALGHRPHYGPGYLKLARAYRLMGAPGKGEEAARRALELSGSEGERRLAEEFLRDPTGTETGPPTDFID
jgi:protein O-mannosyl-transferase